MEEAGFFETIVISVITSVMAENFVFSRAFGVSTMIIAAKSKRNLAGICIGVVYFSLASAAATWAVYASGMLDELQPALIPAAYAVIIGVIYVLTLLLAFIFARSKFAKIKKYVHISAFNSAVMGTIFLSAAGCKSIFEYLIFGLCAGMGFAAASYMLSGVYAQLYSDNVPRAFRGYPAIMIFSGIMAMAIYGVLGHLPSYV